MSTIKFESRVIPTVDLQPFFKDSGLKYTEEPLTEPHRGAVETILHFVTENLEVIKFLVGISGAFYAWIEYQKLQLEKRKDTREAEEHEVEMELKRLEALEKKATLRMTLKNGDVLILANGTEKEIAQQMEQSAPGLKASQIKRVELK